MKTKQKPWDHVEVEESGDDQWIVSYADMVTLLFGFFVILYSFSNLDERKFDQMSETLASAFKSVDDKTNVEMDAKVSTEERQIRALHMIVAMLNLGDNMDQGVKKIEELAIGEADTSTVKAQLKDSLKNMSGMEMSTKKSANAPTFEMILSEGILFGAGETDLQSNAKSAIARIALSLKKLPLIERIEIVGHSDAVPPSSSSRFRSNFALSSARAGSVAAVLIENGISPETLQVRGMADLEPLVGRTGQKDLSRDQAAKNRRVHILVRTVKRE